MPSELTDSSLGSANVILKSCADFGSIDELINVSSRSRTKVRFRLLLVFFANCLLPSALATALYSGKDLMNLLGSIKRRLQGVITVLIRGEQLVKKFHAAF